MPDKPDFESLKAPVTEETHAWAEAEAKRLGLDTMTPEERAEAIGKAKSLRQTLREIREMRD